MYKRPKYNSTPNKKEKKKITNYQMDHHHHHSSSNVSDHLTFNITNAMDHFVAVATLLIHAFI